MEPEEMAWLQEMMQISGVQQEPEEEEEEGYPLFFPGMLLEDEKEEEQKMWQQLHVAEQQTLELIEQQEAMRDEAEEDIE